MSPDTSTHAQRYCEGPCGRELAYSNQPTLDDLLNDITAPPPHYRHTTVCVDCVASGYTPGSQPPATVQPAPVPAPAATVKPKHQLAAPTMRPCLGCDRDLNPPVIEPTLVEASNSDPNIPTAHPEHTGVCTDCIADGFRPPDRKSVV